MLFAKKKHSSGKTDSSFSWMPGPYAIAIGLTLLCFVLAWRYAPGADSASGFPVLIDYWQKGLWSLLGFSMQMMLMLVTGHALALSPAASRFIDKNISLIAGHPVHAAAGVGLLSVAAGLINWGLGLIFGAILARKVAEYASRNQVPINYPLIAASAYTSMMVWHGGFSGSAPLTVATPGHSMEAITGIIPLNQTLFSGMNLINVAGCLLLLPLAAVWMAKRNPGRVPDGVQPSAYEESVQKQPSESGIWFKWIPLGLFVFAMVRGFGQSETWYAYFNLDNINLLLLAAGLAFHPSIGSYTRAIEQAMPGAAGILIQFPLYGGIMGLMKDSGLIQVMAENLVQWSNAVTFPLWALISSAVVNILVPSGGAQWQVQGPVLVEAALKLGVPTSKAVMALSYGDQLTNMLQPFWALPLLGITGLKASTILKYSWRFCLVGLLWFAFLLLIF